MRRLSISEASTGKTGRAETIKIRTMYYIDTHTHLFLPEFDHDRDKVVERAIEQGVTKMLLPNVDTESISPLLETVSRHPGNCFAAMGLHPGSVTETFEKDLLLTEACIRKEKIYAIGEIGLDYYWDISRKEEQKEAFRIQLDWASQRMLPVVIHVRNSYGDVMEIVSAMKNERLRGVFHCFTGSAAEAEEIISLGFMLGIGGVLTFKNSGLAQSLENISPEHLLLETDSPYLAPVPHRGKRNESSFIPLIAGRLAEIYGMREEEIARITSASAEKLFGI